MLGIRFGTLRLFLLELAVFLVCYEHYRVYSQCVCSFQIEFESFSFSGCLSLMNYGT